MSSHHYQVRLDAVTQNYSYDAANRLRSTSNTLHDGQNNAIEERTVDRRYYDTAGCVIQDGAGEALNGDYISALTGEDLNASGLTTRKTHFDAAGRTVDMQVLKADGSLSYTLSYQNDAVGNVQTHRISSPDYTQTFTHTYDKRDSYLQTRLDGVRSDNTAKPGYTLSQYDANNQLHSVLDYAQSVGTDELGQTVTTDSLRSTRGFAYDASGAALRKTQDGNTLKQLVVNGQVLSSYGKGADPDKQLKNDGSTNHVQQGDWGTGYQAINASASAGSRYSVTTGMADTLQSLAQSHWGNAALWWKIAQANPQLGEAGPTDVLQAGTSLSLPTQVGGLNNSASTERVYDASQMVGDTTPYLPAPPPQSGGGGCGVLGAIIMIVVAVVATAYVGPQAAAWLTQTVGMSAGAAAVVGGAVGAAAGSVASQGVGMMMGNVKEFSWNAVGQAALMGGVSAGVDIGLQGLAEAGKASEAANAVAQAYAKAGEVTRAVVRQALVTTVVGVAKREFSWRAVVSSAVSAGIAQKVPKLGNIETLIADTGFFSEKNILACEEANIEPLIALARQDHHPHWSERFTQAAPLAADATPMQTMAHRLATLAGKAAYALRKQTVEPVFGIVKSVMGFRQFSLRGLRRVTGEWNLVCLAWNVKRMAVPRLKVG